MGNPAEHAARADAERRGTIVGSDVDRVESAIFGDLRSDVDRVESAIFADLHRCTSCGVGAHVGCSGASSVLVAVAGGLLDTTACSCCGGGASVTRRKALTARVRALEVDLAAHAAHLRLAVHQRDECMAAVRDERRRNAELRAQLASLVDVRAGTTTTSEGER